MRVATVLLSASMDGKSCNQEGAAHRGLKAALEATLHPPVKRAALKHTQQDAEGSAQKSAKGSVLAANG